MGEVIFRDAFGNLITNVSALRLAPSPPESWTVEIAGETIDGLIRTYGDKPAGTVVALVGSSGWLHWPDCLSRNPVAYSSTRHLWLR